MIHAINNLLSGLIRLQVSLRRNSARRRSPGLGSRQVQARLQLGRAASSVVESLEARQLLTTFVVDTLLDQDDGVGVGGISLRDAIAAANAATTADTITFAPALTASGAAEITLLHGQMTFTDTTDKTTITGPGANLLTIDADQLSRIFRVNIVVNAEISGLSITGGKLLTGQGGAIENLGQLTLSNVVLLDNTAEGNGGAIYNGGTLTLSNSTMSGNSATGNGPSGGAIYNNSGTLTILNSTFSGNSGQGGGAIYNVGTTSITQSTISGNTATDTGGGVLNNSGKVTLNNTIVAGNTAVTHKDVSGDLATGGRSNLIGDGTGMTGLTNGNNGNKVGTSGTPIDPKLGALAANGGATKTLALLAGSPAIDAGDNTLIPNGLTTDQRGTVFPRIINSTVDIGAFEFKALAESLVVTTLIDEDNGISDPFYGAGTSLREAINYANAHANDDTVTFAPGLTGGGLATITLSLGVLSFSGTTGKTTIAGPGASLLSVSGNNTSQVFFVPSVAVGEISGLTITGGKAAGATFVTQAGGGINNAGTLTIINSTISGNTSTASAGGGIFNVGGLTISNSTISGNSAGNDGGGIYNEDGGIITLNNSTLSGNSSLGTTLFGGGGIRNVGTITVNNSTFSGNSAAATGGGIFTDSGGTFTLNNSTVAGNTATANGGGIRKGIGGDLVVNNSIIAGNTAAANRDLDGAVVAGGKSNLIGDGTGLTGLTNNTDGNKIGTSDSPIDPKLGPLANNGGPTQTRALLADSPAINAGNNSAIPNGVTTDQRGTGFPRITNSTVDIGAFEVRDLVESLIVTTVTDEDDNTSDPFFGTGTSLREAVNFASSHAGDDTITFAAGLTSGGPATITLTLDAISFFNPVGKTTLAGPGASLLSISGNHLSHILGIDENSDVAVNGLTFTAGSRDGEGGAIFNEGTLTITQSAFTGNSSADDGGAIANSGTLTITSSTFSGNSADGNGGAIANFGTLTITNSTFSGNSVSTKLAGAIFNNTAATLTISNSTFSGNSAPNDSGGAIFSRAGTLTMNNTLVAGNTAGSNPDIDGVVTAGKSNLIGNGTGLTGISNGVDGNQVGTALLPIDPKLGPLSGNGGPTLTRALLANSPAINAGDNTLIPNGITTDQRGTDYPRAVFSTVDIGAFEAHPPESLSLSNNTLPENQPANTTVGTLSSTDSDAGETFSFSLTGGDGSTDNALFAVTGNTLKSAAVLDLEQQGEYHIRLKSTDATGLTFEKSFTITLTNVNEDPTDLALNPASIIEGLPVGTNVGTFSTTDPDVANTFTYTLVDGEGSADNASFTVTGDTLKSAAIFDFAVQNSFHIRVKSTDGGGLSFEKALTVSVENSNSAPTDLALSAATLAENLPADTTIGTFSTTDIDEGDTFTYTLVSGEGSADNASFTVSGNTLKSAAPFNFESQNVFLIRVNTNDGHGHNFEKQFTISVTNANETPTNLAVSPPAVDENQPVGTTVGILSTTDADAGDTFTYTLVEGDGDADNALFSISGDALQTAAIFDFEQQSVLHVRIRATDSGGLSFERALDIQVGNANDAPTDIALSPGTINENLPAGASVGDFSTTDIDAGDPFTYTLVSGDGDTDNALFTIEGATLKSAAIFDFEAAHTRTIRVRTSDGHGHEFEKSFTIDIGNQNDAPTDIALSATSVAENQPAGTAVGTFSSTDIDAGDTFNYSLVSGDGGTDNASFTIDGDTLKSAAVFDVEAQSTFQIRVRVTDSAANSFEKAFTITAVHRLIAAPAVLAVVDDTGVSNADGLTNDSSPRITGSSEPGMNITLQIDGPAASTGTTTADANGVWSFDTVNLTDHDYTVIATADDGNGSTSAPSATFHFTIDTAGPTVTATATPSNAPFDEVHFVFDGPVNGFSTDDLALSRAGTAISLAGATLGSADNINWTLAGLASSTALPGTYTLALTPAGITDPAGNALAGTTSFDFVVPAPLDTIAPKAKLKTPATLTRAGDRPYSFTVVYTDPSKIRASSIGNKNIKVTGPHNFTAFAVKSKVVFSNDGKILTVTYKLAAPRGGWSRARNGRYTLNLQPNQVKDLRGNAIAAKSLGKFTVAIA